MPITAAPPKHRTYNRTMSDSTDRVMHVTLPLTEERWAFIERKAAEGGHASVVDYLESLVEMEEAKQQLRDKLIDGRDSGRSELSHEEIFARARRIARGESVDQLD